MFNSKDQQNSATNILKAHSFIYTFARIYMYSFEA